MNTLFYWVLIIGLCCAARGAEEVPATITCKNGLVVQVKSVIRVDENGVVVKHRGGADPFQFRYMTPESEKAWRAFAARKVATEAEAKDRAANATHHFAGQIFVTTQGAGTYKFGGVTVKISDAITAVETVTDADGNFSFTWKGDGPFVIKATASRLVGKTWEHFVWSVGRGQIADERRVYLTGDNAIVL